MEVNEQLKCIYGEWVKNENVRLTPVLYLEKSFKSFKPISAVLSLYKSELSELFLNQLSILIQTLFSKN